MSLISAKGLGKRYLMESGPVDALIDVDLDIAKGESVAVMGPSGSGKSTLMHLVGGLDGPTFGTYRFNNQSLESMDDQTLSAIRSRQIGFVFQSYNLIAQYTVRENVEAPFFFRRGGGEGRIEAAIERVGLGHRKGHLPSQLSGGEQQRVAIARALVNDPLLICADEPTGNLDSVTGEAILDLFGELNREGVTLVIVTHDERVAQFCRRTIHLKDGRIVD